MCNKESSTYRTLLRQILLTGIIDFCQLSTKFCLFTLLYENMSDKYLIPNMKKR